MRLKSLMAAVLVSIVSLGFVGCGSSSDTTDFVATTADTTVAATGAATFNFVTAQNAFTVDANSTNLRFQFFVGGAADAALTTTVPFQASITVNGIPTSVTTVVITALDANGVPLETISQAISITGGETVTIDGISTAQDVLLSNIFVAAGNVVDVNRVVLDRVAVAAGSTFQVFLVAEYSNGDQILIQSGANYDIPATDSGIATVSGTGLITAVAVGNTTLTVTFGGQNLTTPIAVTNGDPLTFASVAIVNASPVSVSAGTPVTLFLTGEVTGVGTFNVASTDANVAYTLSNANEFSVTNGQVSTTGASGATSTLTATYTNFDNTQVTSTAVTLQVP